MCAFLEAHLISKNIKSIFFIFSSFKIIESNEIQNFTQKYTYKNLFVVLYSEFPMNRHLPWQRICTYIKQGTYVINILVLESFQEKFLRAAKVWGRPLAKTASLPPGWLLGPGWGAILKFCIVGEGMEGNAPFTGWAWLAPGETWQHSSGAEQVAEGVSGGWGATRDCGGRGVSASGAGGLLESRQTLLWLLL